MPSRTACLSKKGCGFATPECRAQRDVAVHPRPAPPPPLLAAPRPSTTALGDLEIRWVVSAEHALLLTSLIVRDGVAGLPDAIAVHSAPDVVCGAFDAKTWRDSGDPGWPPWDPARRAWTWRGSSDDLLPTTTIEIERFEGPLFLSHGTQDTLWSVEMTRRLWDRLKRHGRNPEVHLYEGEDHEFKSDSENQHNELLIDFFARHLG